jgi:hypothetical protein
MRTTFERAVGGEFDSAFEQALVDEISKAIALASTCSDQKVTVLRTGEMLGALATCMSATLSLRQDMAVPNKLREMVEALARRIKRDAAKAIAEGQAADAQVGHA